MKPIVVSQGVEIQNPKLKELADTIVKTMELSAEKAVAHYFDPEAYPLAADSDSFERIFLTQFEKLPLGQREAARIKVMERVTAGEAAQRARYGPLAKVNLKAEKVVSSQANVMAHLPRLDLSDIELLDGDYRPGFGHPAKPGQVVYKGPSRGSFEKLMSHRSIDLLYAHLGGESGFLGAPLSAEKVACDGVGRYRDYEGGSIYWSPQSTVWAHEVHGAIRELYRSLGAECGPLGYPVTDELKTPDGIGRYNQFQNGFIYWSPETGAHEVHGAIGEQWQALGSEQSVLGYPITDESGTPDGVGRYNQFQNGSIYWSPETGAHEVHGAILELWKSLGWETSYLGYPLTDELATADGKGHYNVFQGGTIYWYPETGAYVGSTQSVSTLAFRMLKLHCIDETGYAGPFGLGESGEDNMFIGGSVIDTYGTVIKVNQIDLGNYYDDGNWDKWDPFFFHEFPINQQDGMWPKNFIVTMVLFQADGGGYNDFMNELMAKLKPYVEDELEKAFIAAGGIIGIPGGPIGVAVGAIAGYVAAYVVEEVFNLVADWWQDDIYKPQTVSVSLPGPNALFDGGAYETDDIHFLVSDENSEYEWWGDWVVY
jgi:hypothetical protein